MALWVRKLLHDFNLKPETLEMCADNQGAIAMYKEWKVSDATKHIAAAYHLQRNYLEKKLFDMSYFSTDDMVADGMMKPLMSTKMHGNCVMFGVLDLNKITAISNRDGSS